MSKLLMDEHPLVIQPKLAVAFGLNEAIFIQQIHYWIQKSDNTIDGKVWAYNSYEELQEQFPFWSIATIKRIVKTLKEKGILYVDNFNKDKWNKTNWYALNYDAVNRTIDSINLTPSGECQDDTVDSINLTPSYNVQRLHRDYTETTRDDEQEKEDSLDADKKTFQELNSSQKLDLLKSILSKHIGLAKIKIYKDDLSQAKELVEQIDDLDDFVEAYKEHRRSLKDKQYTKPLFGFLSAYVAGDIKGPKRIEDDYKCAIHPEWKKLPDGMYLTVIGTVMNPFTGNIIPDDEYDWSKLA